MDKFTISIKDACVYPLIEADTQEEAIEKALEWWNERMPNIQVTIHKNCHFHCPVNAWDCPYFSHTEKEPCLQRFCKRMDGIWHYPCVFNR